MLYSGFSTKRVWNCDLDQQDRVIIHIFKHLLCAQHYGRKPVGTVKPRTFLAYSPTYEEQLRTSFHLSAVISSAQVTHARNKWEHLTDDNHGRMEKGVEIQFPALS